MKNISNSWVKCLFGICILFVMPNAMALECIIEGKSPAIKVQWANKEFAVFRQMASSNCEGAKIIEGDAIVYFSDKTGNSMKVEIKAGQSISPATLKAGEDNTGPISMVIEQMRIILLGDKSIVTGQKRALVEEELNGFPYGHVLPPQDSLEIEIGRYSKKSVTKFILMSEASPSKPIYSNNAPSVTLSIPSRLFVKNGRYKWIAIEGGKEYRGEFRIASDKEEREIISYRQQLDESGKTLTPLGKAIIEAGLYSDYGYKFDSARILGQALR